MDRLEIGDGFLLVQDMKTRKLVDYLIDNGELWETISILLKDYANADGTKNQHVSSALADLKSNVTDSVTNSVKQELSSMQQNILETVMSELGKLKASGIAVATPVSNTPNTEEAIPEVVEVKARKPKVAVKKGNGKGKKNNPLLANLDAYKKTKGIK